MNKIYFIEYDYETESIVRGADGLCKVVPRGQPGLLVAEINKMAVFDGYTSKSQTDHKIIRVCKKI